MTSTPAFATEIHQALRAYHRDAGLAALEWLPTLTIVQAQLHRQPGAGPAAAVRTVLDRGLDRLAQTDARAANLLVRRFVDRHTVRQIMRDLGFSESAVYHHQRQALMALSRVIWEAEERAQQQAAISQARQQVLDQLPPPTFSRLFGVEQVLPRLKRFLLAENSAWLIAVEGMGGIGKTALARQAVEDLVCEGHFQAVAWITAQQRAFVAGHLHESSRPALTYTALLDELARALHLTVRMDLDEPEQVRRLRGALGGSRTVLVVDNLETAADVWALIAGLDRLARPAKVLLTSRQRVAAYDQVTSLPLRELPPTDALAFLRYHSQERNVPALLEATDSELLRIVTVTDGNPLAIKLVVGQLLSLPLAQVLDDLSAARPASHDFYHFLFRYAWERLSEPARHLLLHMPLLDSRGATWADLVAVSGATLDGDFRHALEELVAASLLNAGWTQGRLLYSIHRLTEYFILSDLVGLKEHLPLYESQAPL